MNSVQKSKPLANSRSKTPKSTSNSKRALDDILGKARNTLDQSRQFRDAQLAGLRQPRLGTVGQELGSEKPNYFNDIRKIPLTELAAATPLRRPGASGVAVDFKSTKDYGGLLQERFESTKSGSGQRYTVGAKTSSDRRKYKADEYDSSSSSSSSAAKEVGTSSDGETGSDSTITPPTITGTTESSRRNVKAEVARKKSKSVVPPSQGADGSLSLSSMHSFSNKTEKNLLERTLLIRGDPVSRESYAVLKAMMFEKEHREVDGHSPQSKSPMRQLSYTEDFVTDKENSSIEVPKTATDMDNTEIPEDNDDNEDFDNVDDLQSHVSSVTMPETASSQIVEQIADNLKVLEVSDYILHDEEDDEEPVPSMDEQIAMDDLEVLQEIEKKEDEELYSIMGKSSLAAPSSVASSSLIKSHLQGQDPASASTSSKKSSKSSKGASSSSKSISQSHKVSKASMLSMLSQSRQSSRKTFQHVLSQVKIDDEKDIEDKELDYAPPTTRPQRNIQTILEKEVYQKELKKMRNIRKREELQKKRVSEAKAQTLRAFQAAEDSGIVYKEPSYTKILLPELINDPMISSTAKNSESNLGAPYFNLNGSLGFDYSIQNYPRTPDGNFNNEVAKMDIPQLVREVLASNERMYKMTIDAAEEMGKEYGKNTKMLLKIKKNKEVQRRQKKN